MISANKREKGPSQTKRELKYGAHHLIKSVAEEIGLVNDLKEVFPEDYLEILSLSEYLVVSDYTPLYRFEAFNYDNIHFAMENIPSPRSSELLARITDTKIHEMFE